MVSRRSVAGSSRAEVGKRRSSTSRRRMLAAAMYLRHESVVHVRRDVARRTVTDTRPHVVPVVLRSLIYAEEKDHRIYQQADMDVHVTSNRRGMVVETNVLPYERPERRLS